ncbi:YALI0D06710p [Yarrowia lipolytica CLIB122]|uniref:YALI0D06710p n=2 Tax=Yarrowia lipolytica TaxID=4952 RepID=Q6CA14_YARLI|nr:YALI0D06710p [Yarrowia lipolytica CLIB122]KAJ8054710.1 hypothetical protein LXG23DRAFT_48970 [Yarrowia lipolytica]CAG80686.1 YALI0D06710p [Yarrowia lipolytica CLIB122]SEI37032.1 YALIA101S20e00144g1_1 [Yarrowia lipolytica]|eukprot:XP_502498.1 YALI0D06710p [Yarrowia lipolytica CLIB122]
MGLRESQERSRNRESSRNREGNRLRDKQRGDLRERGERGERRERLKSRDKERGRNRDREKDFSNKDARKERFRSITGKDWGRNVTTVDEGAQHYAIIKSPMAYIPSSINFYAVSPDSTNRILFFKGVPAYVGVNDVVAQACGGPLEKVVVHPTMFGGTGEEADDNTIEFHFVEAEHARNFYHYSRTGRYIVNGQPFCPQWFFQGSDPIDPEVMVHISTEGARRVLDLTLSHGSKDEVAAMIATYGMGGGPGGHEKSGVGVGGYSRESKRRGVKVVSLGTNIAEIQRDFEFYGKVISVVPLATTQCTISIHYEDVWSATKAYAAFMRRDFVSRKYKSWTISYGHDPVDRPCPGSLL